jgi:hypothetical protein
MSDLLTAAIEAGERLARYSASLPLDAFDYVEAGFEGDEPIYSRLDLKPGPRRIEYARLLFASVRAQAAYAKDGAN